MSYTEKREEIMTTLVDKSTELNALYDDLIKFHEEAYKVSQLVKESNLDLANKRNEIILKVPAKELGANTEARSAEINSRLANDIAANEAILRRASLVQHQIKLLDIKITSVKSLISVNKALLEALVV